MIENEDRKRRAGMTSADAGTPELRHEGKGEGPIENLGDENPLTASWPRGVRAEPQQLARR